MPGRPRPRAKPQASRRKGRRRQLPPPSPLASEAAGAVGSRAVPFAPRSRPAAEATAAPQRARVHDYRYVLRELRRIAIIGTATLLLVVVLSLVLR